MRRAFLHQAAACDASGSPLYRDVCRSLAGAPRPLAPVDDDIGHHPIRVLGGLHYLALRDGVDTWRDPVGAVEAHRDWLAEFIRTRRVQTNEVQRCWALLPALLSLGAPRVELLELGPSAGLNLLLTRYRYRYENGGWGPADAPLVLDGEERAPVPEALLVRKVEVVRRRGVDLDPVDATTEDARLLLRAFVWADQAERLARLDAALAALASDPPELIRGDYVELLPELLDDRVDDALLVVFQTASTQYLTPERYTELELAMSSARGPVAFISTRRTEERSDPAFHHGYELEAGMWSKRRTLVARLGFHGQWLEWLAGPA